MKAFSIKRTVFGNPQKGQKVVRTDSPASILHKSTAGRYRHVSYPDGPIRPAIDLCRMLTGTYVFVTKDNAALLQVSFYIIKSFYMYLQPLPHYLLTP